MQALLIVANVLLSLVAEVAVQCLTYIHRKRLVGTQGHFSVYLPHCFVSHLHNVKLHPRCVAKHHCKTSSLTENESLPASFSILNTGLVKKLTVIGLPQCLLLFCPFFGQPNNLSSQNTASERQELKENKVKFMASQLLAKFEESTPSCTLRRQVKSNYHS